MTTAALIVRGKQRKRVMRKVSVGELSEVKEAMFRKRITGWKLIKMRQ